LIVHFLASIYFVVYLNLGILGTGYSSACSFLVTFLALIYFSFQQKEIQETMVWPDRRIFLGLREYLQIAIPSMLMIFLDWWVWELMILLSGYLSVPEQAAQIVLMNIKSFLYMFGLGME
jgi:MATE family multidrug resistance protein